MTRRKKMVAAAAMAIPFSLVPAVNGTAHAGTGCSWKAKQAVKIRASASASSTALGQMNAGQELFCPSAAEGPITVNGGSYTACGSTSKVWASVVYKSRIAYVARTCVYIT